MGKKGRYDFVDKGEKIKTVACNHYGPRKARRSRQSFWDHFLYANYPFRPLFTDISPIFNRCHFFYLFELSVEIGQIIKTAFIGNFRDYLFR